jgi:hypothetical protein
MNYQQPYFYTDYSRNHHHTSYPSSYNLQQQTLTVIGPAVSHGLREAQHLGYQHALTEAVAIGYLMGRGYDYNKALKMVESWWRPPGTPIHTPY